MNIWIMATLVPLKIAIEIRETDEFQTRQKQNTNHVSEREREREGGFERIACKQNEFQTRIYTI